MKKRRGIDRRFGKNIGKTLVEVFCVVLICSMMLQAAQTMFGGEQPTSVKGKSSYVIEGYVYHPYVNRTIKNATIVFWNLRTEEGNITNTDDSGYYSIDLDEYNISHEPEDQIRILTYYMHYMDNQTITLAGNCTDTVNIKLRNNNHFNNYTIPDTNITIPNGTEYNFTEPEFPEYNYTEYNYTEPGNYTYPENSTKQLLNLTVTDVSYDELVKGNETLLNITIGNINNATAYNVTAEIIYVDNSDVSLGNLGYGDILSDENKTNSVLWTPVKSGNNYLKVIVWSENQTTNTMFEENSMEIGFYVATAEPLYSGHTVIPAEQEPETDPETGWWIGPWVVTADTVVYDEDRVLDGDLIVTSGVTLTFERDVILRIKGDITIQSDATLTFKKNVKLIMMPRDPPYEIIPRTIEVQSGARFEILGEKGAESIVQAQSSSRPFEFICQARSSLSMQNGIVMWTYGEPYNPHYPDYETPKPGGIQLYTNSRAFIQDSEIIGGETHNIYGKGASITIDNSRITGNRVTGGSGIGYGVYLIKNETANKESSLYLNDAVIEKSWEDGICAYKSGVYITGSEITENNYGVYLKEANPEVKVYTDYLSDGRSEKEIMFAQAWEDISYLTIPKDATVTNASIKLTGGDNALSFDGDNDYVDVGTMGDFGSTLSEPKTYEMWFKTTSTAQMFLFGLFNPGMTAQIGAQLQNGIITYGMRDDTGNGSYYGFQTDSVNYYDGKWHHVAIIAFPSTRTGKIFFDGNDMSLTYTLYERAPSNFSNFTYGLPIGAVNVRGSLSHYFNGTIDEVRILNRALEQFEIQEDYNAVRYPKRGETVLWYHFDEGLEDTVYDSSGNENTGTIHNATWAKSFSPVNPTLNVGDDSSIEWNYTGAFNFTQEINITTALNQYIKTAKPVCGNVIVPLKITSQSAGKIKISDIAIEWGKDTTIAENTVTHNSRGIQFASSDDVNIADCDIAHNTFGIYFVSSSDNDIADCDVYNNSQYGIYLKDSSNNNQITSCNLYNNSAYGIFLRHYSNNSIITNCNAYDNYVGIFQQYSSNNTITNCYVYNNFGYDSGYGILSDSSSNNTVTNSNVYNNYYGIYLGSSSDNDVINTAVYSNSLGIRLDASSNNNITNSYVYSNCEYGIGLYPYSNNNQITSCGVHNNSRGIYLGSSLSNNITNCNVYNNSEEGIYLSSSSTNNRITNCAIYDNYNGIYLYSSSNSNRITNCDVYNNSRNGIYLYDSSSNNNITSCTVYNNYYDGIRLWSFSNNNQITNCNVYNNYLDGISLWLYSDNNQITNCNVRNSLYGIFLAYSSNNDLANCNVYNNSVYGIYLSTFSNNSRITNCNVYNNSVSGIMLWWCSSNNQLADCAVHNNNGHGIWVLGSSYNNIADSAVYRNSVCGIYSYNSLSIIEDSNVRDNLYGIYLDISPATISNNVIKENHGYGIYSTSPEGTSSDVEIRDNYISDNILSDQYAFGIYASGTKGVIENNMITGHRTPTYNGEGTFLCDIGTGIRCENAPLVIKKNEISGNVEGIVAINTQTNEGIKIEENSIHTNMGKYGSDPVAYGTGIATNNSLSVIDNNTIKNNPHGIHLSGNSQATIINNNIVFDKYIFDEYQFIDIWGIVTDRFDSVGQNRATANWIVDGDVEVKCALEYMRPIDDGYTHEIYPMQIALVGTLTCKITGKIVFQNVEYYAGYFYDETEGLIISSIEVEQGGKFCVYSEIERKPNIEPTIMDYLNWDYPSGFTKGYALGYTFKVRHSGKIELKDSYIEYCGYDSSEAIDNRGLYLASNDVIIENCIFRNNSYGIIADGINLDVTNSKIENSTNLDVYLTNDTRVNLINTNVTVDGTKVTANAQFGDSLSNLSVYWYVDIITQREVSSNVFIGIEEANVIVYDCYDLPAFADATKKGGLISKAIIRQYRQTGIGTTTYTPHKFVAIYDIYDSCVDNVTIDCGQIVTLVLGENRPTVNITALLSVTEQPTPVAGIVMIEGYAGDNVCVKTVELNITGASLETGWRKARGTTEWYYVWDTTQVCDGRYTVMARSFDGQLYSNISCVGVTVDNTPPTTTDNAPSDWQTTPVDITLTANDPTSGVAHIYYKKWLMGTTEPTSYTVYTVTVGAPPTTTVTISDEGTWFVKYYAIDHARNAGTVKYVTIKIDKTPPTGMLSINAGALYTNATSVTLNLSAYDNISNMWQMNFSNDNWATYSGWENYSITKDWTISSGDGAKTVWVNYSNYAGLTIICNDTIILDTTAPTSNIILPLNDTPFSATPVQISGNCYDALSGIDGIEINITNKDTEAVIIPWGGDYAMCNSTHWLYSFTPPSEGNYTIRVRAVDKAKNVQPEIKMVNITYDITAPTSLVDIISPYWQATSPLTLTATANDVLSGLASVELWYRFSTDNTTWNAWTLFGTDTTTPWSWLFTFPNGDGYYQFYSRVRDNAGNYEDAPAVADAFCGYDVTPLNNPTSYTSAPQVNVWSNDTTVYVIWDGAFDALSGIAGYYYAWTTYTYIPTTSDNYTIGRTNTSLPLNDNNNWYLHIRTKDNASNLATGAYSVGPFKIDSTLPQAPTLERPENNTEIDTSTPIFNWTQVDATISGLANYTIQVDNNLDFSSPEYTVNVTINATQSTTLLDDKYYWRVAAIDNAGNVNWSGWRNFTIVDKTPPKLTITITRNATAGELNITVNSTEALQNIWINVTDPNNIMLSLTAYTITDTSWYGIYPIPNINGDYEINATGIDLAGNGNWTIKTFTRATWYNDTYSDFVTGTTENVTITAGGEIILNNTFYAHSEAVIIGGKIYRLLKIVPSDGGAETLDVSIGGADRKEFGRFLTQPFPHSISIPPMTWDFVYRARGEVAGQAHVDVNISILRVDGTITVITDHGADSQDIPLTWTTLSGSFTSTTTFSINTGDRLVIIFYTHKTNPSATPRTFYLQIDDNTLGTDDQTKMVGPYYPLGRYTSPILDAGKQVLWGRIWWWNATVGNTNVTVQIQTSLDNTTWTDWLACTNGNWIPNVTAQYLRYRIILNTTDASVTPSFDNITIEYLVNTGSVSVKEANKISKKYSENKCLSSQDSMSAKVEEILLRKIIAPAKILQYGRQI